MKILHTADWHIGKKLHKHELSKDFDLFINWLCETVLAEKVQVIVVSGDVFDMANPSSEARHQYFQTLIRLCRLGCKLIITGGNHDSPTMLNAPAEILRELDIHVIGGLPENLEDLVIPLKNETNEIECVIAALPYLREANLRKVVEGQSYEDRLEEIQSGIAHYYSEAAKICATKYPEIPAIALGHLFATGAITSDSEREIQIGNQASFNACKFSNYFNYIALGHIHKPQKINASTPIFYSGSPIPLSFSERKDEKRVLLINTTSNWEPKNLPIPQSRRLMKITGTLNELTEKLQDLETPYQLISLIELELNENEYSAESMLRFEDLISNFNQKEFEIVKHRAVFKNQVKSVTEIYSTQLNLEDLKPRKVFQEMLLTQTYDEKISEEILSAFDELLDEIYQDETN